MASLAEEAQESQIVATRNPAGEPGVTPLALPDLESGEGVSQA